MTSAEGSASTPKFPVADDPDEQKLAKLPKGRITSAKTLAKAPYRGICELRTGENNNGSGFVLSSHLIMTAAHVVFDVERKQYRGPFDMTLPSMQRRLDGGNSMLLMHVQFASKPSFGSPYDYAFIVVKEALMDGVFTPMVYNDTAFRKALNFVSGIKPIRLSAAGYPHEPRVLNVLRANFADLTPTHIKYHQDGERGGMSGGPVWDSWREIKNPLSLPPLVGIHIQGLPQNKLGEGPRPYVGNAVRITSEVIEVMREAGGFAHSAWGGAWPPQGQLKELTTPSAVGGQLRTGGRTRSQSVEAAQPERPRADRLYIVDSPDAEVIHLLPDCPGIQTSVHPIRERPFDDRSDLVAAVIEERRRPCEPCSQRASVSAEEAARIKEGLAQPPPEVGAPGADEAVGELRFESGWGRLVVTLDHVEFYERGRDETTTIPMDEVRGAWKRGGILTPYRLHFRYGGAILGGAMSMEFDDQQSRDRAFDQVRELFAAYDQMHGIEPDQP